uniref:Nuclear transcription factor Y subunit gamma n=1 Tax=Rousettus aegyptiacus TaxID=9407 RepID=A0A7J8KD94_ROUAE|nr:nuclear transcription factor Y subunit gamma [Rousettus aegyptiacus]
MSTEGGFGGTSSTDHHKHRRDPADPGAAECRPAAVYSLSPACIRHPSCPGTDPDTCHQCSTDHTDRGPARTAAVQPVHRWTAALPDPASHHACRPRPRPTHVHPVSQPALRRAGPPGDRRLRA